MLNFTHDSRKTNTRGGFFPEQQYQPIEIHNGGNGVQKPMAQPSKSQKKITKTHSNSNYKTNFNNNKQRPKSMKRTERTLENQPWNTQGVVADRNYHQQGVFDKNMKKDSLAAEERKQRAQKKVEQYHAQHAQEVKGHHKKIMNKEQELHYQRMQILTQEKDKQIENLRKMIEKQRAQKEKADQQYELKKRKIEQERKQLIQIERQIQRQGPKASKELKQQLRVMQPQIYPGADRAKCKPDQKTYYDHQKQRPIEITQSESLANQHNKLRQEQLSYLIDQRQRNHQQYQRNTLGYTPTLIPLLSKASYKIISTHVSTLVELFIDELLEEQVYMLEEIELAQHAEKEREKEKDIMRDYVNKLEDFVDEAQIIEDKIGRYSQMRFQDIYRMPGSERRSEYGSSQQYGAGWMNQKDSIERYRPNLYHKLDCTNSLTGERMEEIESRVDRFKRFVTSFDQYKPANMKMFEACTEEMIDEAIMKLAKELDTGSEEFVGMVFRSEFQ